MQRVLKAQARSRGYSLLSGFVTHGLTAEMLPALQSVAAVAAVLPAPYAAAVAAAAHDQVFGLNVFACQSVYLHSAAERGGEEATRVQATYARVGFAPPAAMEADALGCEFAALAHLCAAEAGAWADNQPAAAAQARTRQAHFLADHLLRWLPPLCEALQRQPQPLYATAGTLLFGYVADHLADLAPQAAAALPAAAAHAPGALVPTAQIDGIAAWLLAPACCGLLITQGDLRALAAVCNLPAAGPERRALLLGLFHSAGASSALPALLNALDQRTALASAAYAVMADDNPAVAAFVRPWSERTQATHALLAARRAQVQGVA